MGKTLINNKYNRKRNLFPYTEKILPSGFIKPIFNHLAIPKPIVTGKQIGRAHV